MMKTKLITSFIFTCVLTLLAQGQTADSIDVSRFKAVYTYKLNTLDHENKPITDSVAMVLQVGDKVQKWMTRSAYEKQVHAEEVRKIYTNATREEIAPHLEENAKVFFMHIPTVWTNFPEGKTTTREFIVLDKFEGVGDTRNIQWELSTDTQTISGYPCHAASAEVAGLTWNVWYTEEVPSTSGPWKLHGLPGLIIKAEDSNNYHSFCLNELVMEEAVITYPQDAKYVKTTEKKLIEQHNKIFSNKKFATNPPFFIDHSKIETITILSFTNPPLMEINLLPFCNTCHVLREIEK
ncbi:MAG: GLPGLI family protein [Bacteroidales bacterium]|nr:GLPGLI family protein [Bacteroidales bacterium]